MTSEPTKEAMEATQSVCVEWDVTHRVQRDIALAFDAHTAALRAENAHLKSVNEKGLAELAKLREQVRTARTVPPGYARVGETDHRVTHREPATGPGPARDVLWIAAACKSVGGAE